jgi:3-oxoacyl-[acyl-carrier-protein] synthase II
VATDFLDRKEARKMDRFTQYAMVASDEAIADSILDLDKVNKLRVGVVWGAGIGGLETFQNEVLNYAAGDGTPRFNPFFIPHRKFLVQNWQQWRDIFTCIRFDY